MTAPENFSVDKTGWPDGPWMHEPDRVDFEHAGFPCLILRSLVGGHLCGYVGVPPGHRWHGVDFSIGERLFADPDVHGGITYSDQCAGRICHTPKPGQPDDVWWQGFDCAHAGDLSPQWSSPIRSWQREESYRCVGFVRREVEQLAEQAQAAAEVSRGRS